MSESFSYSKGPARIQTTKRCFSCGRAIREWESGYAGTGLCEDCQIEAEEQADRDNDADEKWAAETRGLPCMGCGAYGCDGHCQE